MVNSSEILNKLLKIIFQVNKAFDFNILCPPTNTFLVKREMLIINLRNLFLGNRKES